VSIKLNKSFLVITFLFVASCDIAVQRDGTTATARPLIITATLPATPTLRPSETLLPPTPLPTITPIEGTTSTRLNVRAEPSTTSDVLGIIAANSKVQITGKDIGGNWWQIVFDAGTDGKGWVTAQYVETESSAQVPVVGSGISSPDLGNMGVAIQQVNIRSGPGTDFNSIGILNVNDTVNLTGKNRNGTWLQIEYAVGPEGKGWVASGFVKSDNTDKLVIVSDTGDALGTGTPADTPLPSTPTVVPAPMDYDTTESPLKTVILGGVGTHTVLYNGDVSFPKGDTEDWISVTPLENILFLGIECLGSDLLQIEIIGMETNISCNGSTQAISVPANAPLLIHIQATTGPENQLQYTKYTLNIKVSP